MSQREVRTRDQGRVLDQVARFRRQKKALESLEQDNFQDEPHADLVMSKRAPKFEESLDPTKTAQNKKKKIRPTDYYKRFRKPLPQLIEEDLLKRDGESFYTSAQASPSKYPNRHWCNVCGVPSNYTCVKCGVLYCSVKCYSTHQETRCLKYTA